MKPDGLEWSLIKISDSFIEQTNGIIYNLSETIQAKTAILLNLPDILANLSGIILITLFEFLLSKILNLKTFNKPSFPCLASRIPYKGVNRAFQTPVYIDQTDKSSYFTTVNPRVATVKNFVENQQLMNIPAGITKVRIYMWLEGQDVDMDNSVAASQLLYNVEFAMIN